VNADARVVGCHRQMANIQQSSVVDRFKSLHLRHTDFGCRHALQGATGTGGSVAVGSNRLRAAGLRREEIMTDQVDFLRAVLRNKRSELARSIRSQSSQLNVCEGEHELVDRMQSMSRRDEAVTFLDTLTRTLTAVDAALLAMKEGSYGTCAECGEPIAARRLQAIPWASHCIRCQEMLDRRNHMRAPIKYWDAAA
jgi:DnaK suppressor protein